MWLSSDSIAHLVELKRGGGVQCKVSNLDIKIMDVGNVLLNEILDSIYLANINQNII